MKTAMKKFNIALLLMGIFTSKTVIGEGLKQQEIEVIQSFNSDDDYREGLTKFAFEVLQNQLAHSDKENQLVSPLGISLMMSMIGHGVGQEDKEEIARLTRLPEDEGALKKNASILIHRLNKQGFDIAGLIYLNDLYQLNPDFQTTVSGTYKSLVQAGSSADEVNAWANNATNGQINHIVSQKELQNFFVLLANAIHFKADWSIPFNGRETYPNVFTTPSGIIETRVMHQTCFADYYEDDHCQAIRLTYKGSPASSVFILPRGLNDFSFIDGDYYQTIMDGLETEMVRISLPAFKLEKEMDAKKMLQEMGMTHLFNSADFSPLVDLNHEPTKAILPSLMISQIKQKSVLACNEKGTEASTVTSAIFIAKAGLAYPKRYKEIDFDRPFMVALMSPQVPVMFGIVRTPN